MPVMWHFIFDIKCPTRNLIKYIYIHYCNGTQINAIERTISPLLNFVVYYGINKILEKVLFYDEFSNN